MHRLSVLGNSNNETSQIDRQKWINALKEHAAYSSHYLWGLEKRKSGSEEEIGSVKPLGCMSDALSSATASFEVLQRQLGECAQLIEALQKSVEGINSSSLQMSALMVNQCALYFLVIF